jgi:hypothetical protein
MLTPLEVRALPDYRLWLRYADGVTGEVDLSYLVGKGVFALWNDPRRFGQVHISRHGSIAWTDEVEMCPDALYLEITGKNVYELFPGLMPKAANA